MIVTYTKFLEHLDNHEVYMEGTSEGKTYGRDGNGLYYTYIDSYLKYKSCYSGRGLYQQYKWYPEHFVLGTFRSKRYD